MLTILFTLNNIDEATQTPKEESFCHRSSILALSEREKNQSFTPLLNTVFSLTIKSTIQAKSTSLVSNQQAILDRQTISILRNHQCCEFSQSTHSYSSIILFNFKFTLIRTESDRYAVVPATRTRGETRLTCLPTFFCTTLRYYINEQPTRNSLVNSLLLRNDLLNLFCLWLLRTRDSCCL